MNNRTWAMACHLSALVGYVTALIGNIVGPLVLWMIKKDEIEEVDYHGKEALNFNLTCMIYMFLCWVPFVLTFGLLFFITLPLLFVLAVFHVVFTIIAAIKANDGVAYRYPLTIRFLK